MSLAQARGCSLGQIALACESALLDLPEDEVLEEVTRRFDVMQAAVRQGLEEDPPPMQLLRPSAHRVYRADAEGRVAVGGLHTRAAARAMAVMHVNGGMGVVCAAPTGGAFGQVDCWVPPVGPSRETALPVATTRRAGPPGRDESPVPGRY